MNLFNMLRKEEFDAIMKKVVVAEERAIRQEFERDWYLQNQQENWHDQIDQDLEAQQDFIELGER